MENMVYETKKYRADDLDIVGGDEEPTPKKKPIDGEIVDDPATDEIDGEDDADNATVPIEELLDEENF